MHTTRRQFLRAGAFGAVTLGVGGGLDVALAAPRRAPRTTVRRDPVVVFVSMFGGNDGLNTVVPLAQYDRYRALRPVIGWPREQLLPLPGYEQDFGVNAALAPLLPLFRQGTIALINGIGFPTTADGLFDHQASQENIFTADISGLPPNGPPTGWLGRLLDRIDPAELPLGFDIGHVPLLLTGARSEPLSLSMLDGFGIAPSVDVDARALAYRRIQELAQPSGVRARNAQIRMQVLELSGVLQGIYDAYRVARGVIYPSGLGSQLRDCAALIAADRGVRAFGVRVTGFDTHSAQNAAAPGDAPYHQALLASVTRALAAFSADLSAHGIADRVVTIVASEFGRRAAENVDAGTDHGIASVALVLGDAITGGVYGDYPDLAEEFLVLDGNLETRIDFRSVYATVIARHFGFDPGPILGGDFTLLSFL